MDLCILFNNLSESSVLPSWSETILNRENDNWFYQLMQAKPTHFWHVFHIYPKTRGDLSHDPIGKTDVFWKRIMVKKPNRFYQSVLGTTALPRYSSAAELLRIRSLFYFNYVTEALRASSGERILETCENTWKMALNMKLRSSCHHQRKNVASEIIWKTRIY